jgi:hypothetical protein
MSVYFVIFFSFKQLRVYIWQKLEIRKKTPSKKSKKKNIIYCRLDIFWSDILLEELNNYKKNIAIITEGQDWKNIL